MVADSQSRLRWVAATATVLLTAVVVMSASPLIWPSSSFARAMHMAFAPVCHQLPDRSYSLGAATMCVCTRCFGIYVGLATGAWAGCLLRVIRSNFPLTSIHWWVAATAPMALQWTLSILSPGMDSAMLRTVTGSLFGLFAGASLVTALYGDALPVTA